MDFLQITCILFQYTLWLISITVTVLLYHMVRNSMATSLKDMNTYFQWCFGVALQPQTIQLFLHLQTILRSCFCYTSQWQPIIPNIVQYFLAVRCLNFVALLVKLD